MGESVLKALNLTKNKKYYNLIEDLSIEIRQGEIISVIGIRGSGKSTLARILGGYHCYGSYSGSIKIDEMELKLRSPKDSDMNGINVLYEDDYLFENLKIYENIYLGSEIRRDGFINWESEINGSKAVLERLHADIDFESRIFSLSFGERQLVKLAKTFVKDGKFIILDEPSVGLTQRECDSLFQIISELKNRGVGICYLTHEPKEALKISDRINIIKNGKFVHSSENDGSLTEDFILSSMTGRTSDREKSKDKTYKEYNITDREREIINYLLRGYSNKEISDKLFISINTVKTHIMNIYQKFGIDNRVELSNFINNI